MDSKNYIKSLLDVDMYKLTMCQHAFEYFSREQVKFQFINRTEVKLGKYIDLDELEDVFDQIRDYTFQDDEIKFLKETGLFKDSFLTFLKGFKLPEIEVGISPTDELMIYSIGDWPNVTMWETIVLSVVNQMFGESYTSNPDYSTATSTLKNKLADLNNVDGQQFNVVDFGTRRRHSAQWHENVTNTLLQAHVAAGGFNLVGTSNVHLAKKFNLKPVGTFAHEMPMIYSGIYRGSDEKLRQSHNQFMDHWYQLYGEELSIALTDTFGSDFFFNTFGRTRAVKWKGLRHDSGDPFDFTEQAIRFYASKDIDPTEKMIVFSDGLSAHKIKALEEHVNGRIQSSYGWGTKLTNDFKDIPKLSIVMKSVEVNDTGLVKLSDNLAKATGTESDIEMYKEVFNHDHEHKELLEV